MAYFIILPAFILWLVIASIALVVVRRSRRYPHAFSYAWRFCLWSTIGFVVANVLLVGILAGAFILMGPASGERTIGRDALQLIVGIGGMVGPILASLAGWLAGGLLGAFREFRAHRQTVV